MSVEFSGQRMKSGIGASPSLAFTIRLMVSLRWLLVTDRIRPRASIPRPGTLPCTMPTCTEPAVAELVSGTYRRPAPSRASTTMPTPTGISRRRAVGSWRRVSSSTTAYATLCATRATQERDAGDADQRQEAGQGRVHGRVREADPAEPAERDPGVEELDQRPAQGRRQRPPAQRRGQVEGEPQQPEEQRLEGDQQDGDPAAEHVDPADRDSQQTQPVEVADPERRPARSGRVAVADEQGQGGDADQQQRPEPVRLPGEPGEHAGQDGGQAAEPAVVTPGEAVGGVDACRVDHIGTGGGHPEILLAWTSDDVDAASAVRCGSAVGVGGRSRANHPRLASSGSRQTRPRPFDAPTHPHRSAVDVRIADARSQSPE